MAVRGWLSAVTRALMMLCVLSPETTPPNWIVDILISR